MAQANARRRYQIARAAEELEIHLRDEIERQIKSGLNEQKAFEISVQQIGPSKALGSEFKKGERTFMKQTIAMLLALPGTVLGGGMILPALGQWRDRGVLHLGPLLVGITLAIIAGCAVIHGVKTYRGAQGRKLISVFLIAADGLRLSSLANLMRIGR